MKKRFRDQNTGQIARINFKKVKKKIISGSTSAPKLKFKL